MKKFLWLSFALLLIPINFASAAEKCANATVVTECSNGQHLAEILTSANCLQTQCLTLDEVALAAESTLSLPEELSEEDLGKVDAKFDTANNLLNIFNQEVSTRRTELAELKQTAARIESDPEAYAEELKGLLAELSSEEKKKQDYEIALTSVDQEISTAVSELEALLQNEPSEIQNVYQSIIQKYRGNTVSFNKIFDFKKLQAASTFTDINPTGNLNTTFAPTPEPDVPEVNMLGTNPIDNRISVIEKQMSLMDEDINAAQASISQARIGVQDAETEIQTLNDAQRFEALQKSETIISATDGVTNNVEKIDTVIANFEARDRSKLSITERESIDQQLQELKKYKELSAQKSDFEEKGFLGLDEQAVIDKRTELVDNKKDAETVLTKVQKIQNPVIEAKEQAKEDLQPDLLDAKAEQAEWKAKNTTGKESQENYDTQADLLRERAESTSGEERIELQTKELDARLNALDAIDPDGKNETINNQREWLEAQKTLVTTETEFNDNRAAIKAKTDEIRALESEKHGLENDLSAANDKVRLAKQALDSATAKNLSEPEIQKLKEDLAKAELDQSEAQKLLDAKKDAINEKIETKKTELAELEKKQEALNEKRQEARSTLSENPCTYKDATNNNIYTNEYCVQLESAIGSTQSIHGKTGLDLLRNYIGVMYKYFASIIGILAVLVIVVSGIQMSMAGFNSEFSSQAKTRIFQALASLILLFLISLILRTVNPIFFTKIDSETETKITATV